MLGQVDAESRAKADVTYFAVSNQNMACGNCGQGGASPEAMRRRFHRALEFQPNAAIHDEAVISRPDIGCPLAVCGSDRQQ